MKAIDARAVAVWKSPELAAARKDVEAMYAVDPNAASPLARARVAADVAEYAFAAAQVAVDDPYRPQFQWCNSWKRSYGDLEVPAGRYGTDNPDNVYRFVAIAPECAYRIDGQLNNCPPTVFTFSLMSGNYAVTSHISTVSILTSSDLVVDAGGRFSIRIDAEAAGGRRNHIQSTANARMLNLRETLGDWERETPSRLTITRVDDGPTPASPSPQQLAERAAEILRTGSPHWALRFQHDSYEKLPFNQPQPIMSSAKRLGGLVTQSSSHGRFALEEDEALVIRIDPFDCDYLGFQLADVWMVSAEYADRLGCVNNFQAKRDADGRYTFVICRVDPGVHNWLDAGGLDTGGTTIRYQGLKNPSIDYSGAFETKHVKLFNLDTALPPETVWVTAAERAAQLLTRGASYRRRELVLLG